jgi:hypothetical protein
MEIRMSKHLSDVVVDGYSDKSPNTNYNKGGLVMANENLMVHKLPFIETLQICEFPVDEHDENEDIEREVIHAFYYYRL